MPWAQEIHNTALPHLSALERMLAHGLYRLILADSKIITPLWGCLGLIQHALK